MSPASGGTRVKPMVMPRMMPNSATAIRTMPDLTSLACAMRSTSGAGSSLSAARSVPSKVNTMHMQIRILGSIERIHQSGCLTVPKTAAIDISSSASAAATPLASSRRAHSGPCTLLRRCQSESQAASKVVLFVMGRIVAAPIAACQCLPHVAACHSSRRLSIRHIVLRPRRRLWNDSSHTNHSREFHMSTKLALITCLSLFAGSAAGADKVLPIEPPMVTVKGGAYMMGSLRAASSQPVHEVAIKAFRMGKYEVTAAEFQRFVEATNYKFPRMCIQMAGSKWFANVPGEFSAGTTLQSVSKFEPATCIGWKGADAYVKWLAKETGKQYRLPTEAEWEYAHRAGSTQRYFFGNDETRACRYANLADRSAEAAIRRDFDGLESKEHVGVIPCDDKAGYASIVGMYEPNAFGLHDTLGNVSEYVQDCGSDDYKDAPKDGSAFTGGQCKDRGLRGGTWHWRGFHLAARSAMPADFIGSLEGFRIAEDLGAARAPDAKPSAFETELAQAQAAERARRSAIAEIGRPKT